MEIYEGPCCNDCCYWGREDIKGTEENSAFCHRYPPTIHGGFDKTPKDFSYLDKLRHVSDFPVTHKNNWCGEFTPRRE